MKSNLSIIIVNYNSTSDLKNSINSIYKNIFNLNYEIIVVDNNSPERDIEQLPAQFPDVHFLFEKENLGFSKANNLAFKYSKYENVLFLNPDTIFIEDCITPLINFISKNKDTGACGVKLLNKDRSFQFSFGKKLGFIYETAEALMLIGFYRKLFYNSISRQFKLKEAVKVEWLSGAFLLMRKGVFESVGGFSSDFFLNYEDIDLCSQIVRKGYSNYYFPNISCIHLDSKSQKKNYERFVFNRYKSRLIFAKKHYNFFTRFIVKTVHLIGLIFRILTVNFLYKDDERKQRRSGYIKSFFSYSGISLK